ncbi:MAG: hypothetical protein ABR981_05785 [Candidatus Micrarchaeaceae archaeon]|jgi:predicted PurR-regulated permease PerM
MPVNYAIVGLALLVAMSFFGIAAGAQSSNVSSNLTIAINSTQSYIETVNQSSYLVFYPNLSTAYNDLALARNESSINISDAYMLLGKAKESAEEAQSRISQYKTISLYLLVIVGVILAFSLYVLMSPSKAPKRKNN